MNTEEMQMNAEGDEVDIGLIFEDESDLSRVLMQKFNLEGVKCTVGVPIHRARSSGGILQQYIYIYI